MSPRGMPRTEPMSRADVAARCQHSRAFLDVAELVLEDDSDPANPTVSGSLSVMAAIAASDAICGHAFGERPKGDDHKQAVEVLRRVDPDGRALANDLSRCLDEKSNAQYGLRSFTAGRAREVLVRAGRLVQAAESRVR